MGADVLLLSISKYRLRTRKEQRTISSQTINYIYFFFLLEKCFGFSEEKLISILQTVFHQITKKLQFKGISLQFLLPFCFLQVGPMPKTFGTRWDIICVMQQYQCYQHKLKGSISQSKPGACVENGVNIFTQKIAKKCFAFCYTCCTLIQIGI